jgi:antitoxin VapB
MALSIKNEELDQRIRKLAGLTGKSLTTSLRIAVDNEIARWEETKKEDRRAFLSHVRQIQEKIASLPTLTTLSDDDIIGYDENGLPS